MHLSVAYLCLQTRERGDAADTHVDALVGGMRSRGCRVRVFTPTGQAGRSLVARGARGLAAQLALVGGLRQFDLVWVRMHPLAVLSVATARIFRRRVIVEANGIPGDYVAIHPLLRFSKHLLLWLITSQLRFANDVVAVTPGLATWVTESSGQRNVHVVANGADPETFRPGLERPSDVPERYVLFTGALSPWQGLRVTVESVLEPAWPNDVVLVVIGDGVLREEMEDAARASAGRIHYLGRRKPDQVAAYVSNALATLALKDYHDVTVGQSPLKVYESMAAGVPVIGARMHGMAELIDVHDAGVLLDQPDPTAVADTVAALVDDDDERVAMGVRGRRAIVDGHTWAHRMDDILRLVDNGRR